MEQKKGLSPAEPCTDFIQTAVALIREASSTTDATPYKGDMAGSWQKGEVTAVPSTLQWTVQAGKIKNLKGIKITLQDKKTALTLVSVSLVADGQEYPLVKGEKKVPGSVVLPVDMPRSFTGNNECRLKMTLAAGQQAEPAAGKVELIY